MNNGAIALLQPRQYQFAAVMIRILDFEVRRGTL
jgi:hypothetical protein